jgi:hypothetical protein
MRIRLLKPYGFSRPGDVLEPDDPVAQLLIDRGIAEIDSSVLTKEIVEPPRDKAMSRRAAKRKCQRGPSGRR